MPASVEPVVWDAHDAQLWWRVPAVEDDKYSRGVLTVITGSTKYPGAAVLSVEAAARTGIGMIRYIGAAEPTRLVLERRPEVVIQPGQSQAVLMGPGIDPEALDDEQVLSIEGALRGSAPVVLDAGLLGRVKECVAPKVITPHARELARLLGSLGYRVDEHEVTRDPSWWAQVCADMTGATVLLKGATTHIVTPRNEEDDRFYFVVNSTTHWMATAGTGDVLAGILGALVATHAEAVHAESRILGALAATAAFIHAQAGAIASGGGPLVALDVAEAIPAAVAGLR